MIMFMCECGGSVDADAPNMEEMLARFNGERVCKHCSSAICCSCGYLSCDNLLAYVSRALGCTQEEIAEQVTTLISTLPLAKSTLNRALKAAVELAEAAQKATARLYEQRENAKAKN